MLVRRVVTKEDSSGKAVVASDGSPPWAAMLEHTPGFGQTVAWATEPDLTLPTDGTDTTPQMTTMCPGPGATRLVFLTLPPDSVFESPDMDFEKAGAEHAKWAPGIAELMEPDNPGMHRTDTVDYGIVLEGEIWCELDDGEMVHLKQHDCIVQNGTRHGWRNKTDKPTKMVFFLTGVPRK